MFCSGHHNKGPPFSPEIEFWLCQTVAGILLEISYIEREEGEGIKLFKSGVGISFFQKLKMKTKEE